VLPRATPIVPLLLCGSNKITGGGVFLHLADFCLFFFFPSGKKPNRKLSGAVAESCHRLFLVAAIVIAVHYFFAIALNQVPDTFKVLYYSGESSRGKEESSLPPPRPQKEKERNDGRVGADI
jgi:hypothetical protein